MRYQGVFPVLLILFAGCGPSAALPSSEDIASMKGYLSGEEFTIPKPCWGKILSAMEPAKIDPTVDYVFKHLLGRESSRPILISVVDSILKPAPGHQNQDIELPKFTKTAEELTTDLDIWSRPSQTRSAILNYTKGSNRRTIRHG